MADQASTSGRDSLKAVRESLGETDEHVAKIQTSVDSLTLKLDQFLSSFQPQSSPLSSSSPTTTPATTSPTPPLIQPTSQPHASASSSQPQIQRFGMDPSSLPAVMGSGTGYGAGGSSFASGAGGGGLGGDNGKVAGGGSVTHQFESRLSSLRQQFRTVEDTILLSILDGSFKPSHLPRLQHAAEGRSSSSDTNDDHIFSFDPSSGGITSKRKEVTSKQIPSVVAWLRLWHVYSSIVAFAWPNNAFGIIKYTGKICFLAERYQWSAVLRYHLDFHESKLKEGLGFCNWLEVNMELHSAVTCSPRGTTDSSFRPTSSSSSSAPKGSKLAGKGGGSWKGTCRAWNTSGGVCSFGENCSFRHECPDDGGKDHQAEPGKCSKGK